MRSMTGYARYSVELDGRNLLIELKSVNHRFIDLNIKLPRAHNFAETALRKIIQDNVTRGHIDVYVTYQDNRENKTEFKVNESIAGAYLKLASDLSLKHNIPNDYTVSNLIKAPDVVTEVPVEDNEKIIDNMYSECIIGAVNSLNSMKQIEGDTIKKELVQRINTIKQSLENIRIRAPKVFEEYGDRLRTRVQEALKEAVIDESRLLNEVAVYADKSAIDEEISRLGSHIEAFLQLAESEDICGKKMDFVVQEMNRETNTIGSKANDITIVNEVLAMKAEIEKIREQIQNIE